MLMHVDSVTSLRPSARSGGAFVRRHRQPLLRCFVISMVASGCGAAAGPPDPPEDPCAAALAIRSGPQFLSVAEEADIAARVIPGGFGGLYQNLESQRLVVTLKDPAASGPAGTALRALLYCGGAYPGWADELVTPAVMGFRSAQYSGTELLSYLRALQPVRGDLGVWAVEVDPELNRIWIGLVNSSEVPRIRQMVSDRGVPLAAVALEAPPPTTGAEPFAVLENLVLTEAGPALGVFRIIFHVRYTNPFPERRFLDRCPEPFSLHTNVRYVLEKWDGTNWQLVFAPICELTALRPTRVDPLQAHTDSVDNAGVRRLNALPVWRTARVTGTYRLVGSVYLSETAGPPFVANPASDLERRSAPFRIRNTAPF